MSMKVSRAARANRAIISKEQIKTTFMSTSSNLSIRIII